MRAVPITVFPRLIFLGVFLAAVALLLLVFMAPANAANAPSNFSATAGDTQVTLTWNDPDDDDITGYQVLSVAIDKLVVPSTASGANAAGDRFGDSVGVDNNRAVVGAPFQTSKDNSNNDITNGGWGHAFSRSSGGWNYDEFLAVSTPQEDGRLGSSVALAGSTAILGAPSYTHQANADPGRITIASWDSVADSWVTKFTRVGQVGNDLFGSSVALDTGIAVVGAPGAPIGGDALAGKAYLYTKNNSGVWGSAATAIWGAGTNAGAGTIFGSSVAVDGNTVVIGSPGEDSYSGAAYVFTKDSMGIWSAVRLTASDRANADSFGRWVAVDGDFVVVGSWRDDDDGTDSGSVYVFTKPSGGWGDWNGLSSNAKDQLTAKLTASDAAAEDHFGWSVAVDGDNVVVGAYGNDDNGNDSGSVYLFTKPTSGGWVTATETVKLTAPDGAAGDNFGYSVAAGGGRAIVGAPGDDSEKGAVYVFSIPEWTDISSSDSGTTSHTVTGLDNDVEYTFLVRPVVGSGYGSASESKQATPQQSPAVTPANLTALAGVDQVTLSWDDPNDSTISAYKYRQKEGSGSFGQWTTIPDSAYGEANTTGYTVRNLTDGQTYTFRIRAVDEDGDTANSGDVTVTTILAAPANLMATVGGGQIGLNWDNPNNNLITKYQYSTNGGTSFNDIDGSNAATTAYTVTGLSNGDPYTLAVRAVNAAVNGEASTVTATPLLPAPTNLVAAAYSERVVLEWDTGGVGYEQYQITIETSGTGVVPTAYIVSASSEPKTSVEITSLTDNTEYTFSVQAVYVPPGFSSTPKITGMAAAVTATPIPVPAAPSNLSAAPGDEMAALSWDDPANRTITKYELLQLAEESELIASDAAKNDRFGVSVAVDDDTAVVGAFQPTYEDSGVTISRPGAAYVYTKDSNGAWSQQAKLTASAGADGDEFGISVAVDGDTAVVGARGNVSKTGAIYVFTKPSDGDWTSNITETKLTATGGAADDLFGASVALYGGTIVVGAPGAGSAYVFTWNSETGEWSQNAKLTASNAGADDLFGNSVAVDGNTIAVGAYGKDGNSLADYGLVYVFVKSNTGVAWATTTETVQLKASGQAANANFGRSVAVDGGTIVVGASGDQNTVGGAEVSTGSAYVFTEPSNGWADGSVVTETAKLTASDGADSDQFGRSVAVDGNTIVVGAHQNDDDGTDSGSIYVFIKPTNGWTDTTGTVKLTAANAATGDRFGIALALDGDTALVAAPRNDANDDDDAGSAYVFDIKGWDDIADAAVQNRSHTVTDLTNYITYMFAVRAVNPSGDGPAATDTATPVPVPAAPVNLSATPGDGEVALSWGNPGNATITKYQYSTDGGANFSDFDGGSSASTTSYTITGLDNSTEYTLALRAVNPTGNGEASTVTALILPAKPTGLTGIEYNSQVELGWDDPDDSTITKYQLLRITPRKLTAGGAGRDDDFFGMAVAADGDTALVGALQAYDADFNNRPGAAYVFTWNSVSEVWTKNATLNASDGDNGDGFGRSVALDGDTAVVGAYQNDEGKPGEIQVTNTGSAYIFTKDSQGMWKQTAQLTASDAADGDQFGYSVAVDGDTIVVGAHLDDDGDGAESGSVYVFTKPSGDNGWDDWNSLSADGKAMLTTKLTAPGAAAGGYFGNSVAIDGNTIVVGARKADSAYAITKPSSDTNSDGSIDWEDWDSLDADGKATLTATLTAFDAAAEDEFGISVAIDGNTVVVGAHQHDQSDTVNNSGAAYVFTKPGNAWATGTETAKLTASDGTSGDEFGISVAVSGNTIVIGAHLDDDKGDKSGSAYFFTKPINGNWATGTETVKIIDHAGAAEDHFGWSVAVDGSTAVVGAYGDGSNKGAAHIMGIPSWTDISNSAPGEANATSYAVTGLTNDVMYTFQLRAVNASGHSPASDTLDATPKAVPHAPANLSAAGGNGQVALTWGDPKDDTITGYQYSTDGGASFSDITNSDKNTYTVTRLTNGVTHTLALRAVNSLGDGAASTVRALMAPAAPANLSAAPGDTQAALSWDDPGNDTITEYQVWRHAEIAKLVEGNGAATSDVFGNAVAVDGDTAVIGAPGDVNNGVQTGAAFVFTKGSDGWSRRAKLIAKDPEGGDQFGFSVAMDGDTIVVGVLSDGLTVAEAGGTAAAGAGSAYVFAKPTGGWANWNDLTDTAKDGLTAKLIADDAEAGDQFGRSVAVDESTGTVVVGAWHHGGTDTEGAAYVFTKDSTGWSQAAKLTASVPLANDYFGRTVALDGDTVLIGASGRDSGKGAAYVFTKPATGWADTTTAADTVTRLTASDGGTNDLFGASVAMDGNTALIGAEGQEWVYVFIRESEGWVEKAKLSSDDPDHDGRGNNFGNSVAVDGDIVVVGADGVDQSDVVNNTGAAYVFTKPSAGWADSNDATRLTGSDAAANDKFGGAVAVDGGTAMVGADNAAGTDDLDNSVSNAGAAYVLDIVDWTDFGGKTTTPHTVTGLTNYQEYWFQIRAVNASGAGPVSNSASATPRIGKPAKPANLAAQPGDEEVMLQWDNPGNDTITGYQISEVIEEGFLTASDGATGDHFGVSVAIDGDTAVVGADRLNARKGAAYIFTRDSNGAWTQQAKLDGEFAGDQFGWSVAVDGDTVVVGAHAYDGEDTNGTNLENSGSVYVYTKPATEGGWADTIAAPAKLTATVPAAYAFFGGSVALDGSTLAIGSRLYNAGGYLSAGAAYVFTKSGTTWSQAAKLTASTSLQLAYLGYSLAVDGDTVLVGAYGDNTVRGELGSGSAYVFDKPSGGWTDGNETAKLTASDHQPSGYFGFSVALDGDTAVIGASQHSDPITGAGSGAAYVFTRQTGVWGEKAKLTPSDAAAGDNFGMSVAVEGDTVVVGSWQDDDNGRNSGSAYVFEKPALGWARTFETLKLTAPGGAVNDRFGWSVAVDLDDARGDLALVGAYSDDHDVDGDDSIDINAGSVHVLGIPDWKDIPNSVATTTAHTVTKELDDPDTDLSNGTEYAFQVRALNQSGAGPASDDVSETPLGPPATLGTLNADAGDTNVTLSWAAAIANATIASITEYEYSTDGGITYADIPGSGANTTRYTVTTLTDGAPLANGTLYTFAVRAVNVIGAGLPGTVEATPADATPAAPVLNADAGDTQVRLMWNDPQDFSIDRYEYQWTGTDGASSWDAEGSSEDWIGVPKLMGRTIAYQYTVAGLTNDVEYTFRVRAVDEPTDFGVKSEGVTATPTGMLFNSLTAVYDPIRPAAPAGLIATGRHQKMELTWDYPDDASIDKYQYQFLQADNAGTFATWGADWTDIPDSNASTTEYIHFGLTNGVNYRFRIRAVDLVASGTDDDEFSDPSDNAEAIPWPHKPGAPTDLNVTVRNQEVTLTWQAPEGSVVDKYEVLYLQASALVNSSVMEGDRFGYSVAVDGDIAVVGAYRDGENGDEVGAAYVFTRSGGVVWDAGVKLTASDGAPYNNLGISVAVDGETVVVGAPGDDDNGTDSGSVYVFTNTNGVWSQAAKLTASDGATLDYFGQSVAVSGDTILVGAYLDDREETVTDSELEDSGSVYVFVKPTNGNGWANGTETTKLTASDAADDDNFGTSVALDGNTAVIGAPGADDNDNGIDSGSAYVFTRNASTGAWSQQTKLTASSDGAAGDALGISVALDGDTAVVGAYLDDREDNTMTTDVDETALDAGSAYVFTRDSGTWSQQAKLMADDGQAEDWFGYSVALDNHTALIGAYGDDDNGSESGSAYVFTRNPDAVPITWSETNKLTEDAGQAGARFGYSVAVDTTAHTALVGAGSAHVMDIHDWAEVPGGSGARSHIFAELTNGRKYDLQVRAVNLAGEGDEADQSTVPHAPQGGNNKAGVVSLSPTQPVVNVELTASLADPDDPVTSVSWRWSKSSDGTTGWSDIPGANSDRYTPIAADVDNYLRASASYTDAFGPGQPAAAVSAARVQSAQGGNNDPYFIDDTLTLTVAENTPVGQNVGRAVTATDPDHDTLTYSLSGTDVAYFDIAPATGQITVGSGATLNYESGATSYTVIVSVHDGNPDSAIDDSIDVTINVADANDAPEAVTDTININENSGATHLNVIANDNDEDGDTLSINVVNGAAVISTPSKGTAVVKAGSTAEITYTPNSTATGPDTFTYEVSDGNGGTDVGTVNVTITPLPGGSDDDPPVNDSPRFNEGASVTRTVPEDAAVGTAVGDPVTARDRNNDRLEYSLSGTDRASFDIDRSTGQLTTSTLLDYEVQNEYSVRVQVEDGQGGFAGIDATITVMDVDEPPAQPEAPEVRSAGLTSLAVGWTAPDNQGPEITDYDLRYREVGGEFQDAGYSGIGTSWALNDLSPTTGYEVQVRAINAEGISLWSESGRGETGQAPSTPAPTPVLEITPTPDPAQAGTPTSTPGPGDASARTPTPTPTPAVGLIGTPAPAQTPGPVVAPATVPATPPAAVGTVPTPTATQAPSASVPEPTTAMPPAAPAEPDSGRGFPIWLIAAIVVAGLLAIVLGYLGVRMLRR